MTQIIRTKYFDPLDPEQLNLKFAGAIQAGVKWGFEPIINPGNQTITIRKGVLFTSEGVEVEETSDLVDYFSFKPGDDFPHNSTDKDKSYLIMASYQYTESPDETACTYRIENMPGDGDGTGMGSFSDYEIPIGIAVVAPNSSTVRVAASITLLWTLNCKLSDDGWRIMHGNSAAIMAVLIKDNMELFDDDDDDDHDNDHEDNGQDSGDNSSDPDEGDDSSSDDEDKDGLGGILIQFAVGQYNDGDLINNWSDAFVLSSEGEKHHLELFDEVDDARGLRDSLGDRLAAGLDDYGNIMLSHTFTGGMPDDGKVFILSTPEIPADRENYDHETMDYPLIGINIMDVHGGNAPYPPPPYPYIPADLWDDSEDNPNDNGDVYYHDPGQYSDKDNLNFKPVCVRYEFNSGNRRLFFGWHEEVLDNDKGWIYLEEKISQYVLSAANNDKPGAYYDPSDPDYSKWYDYFSNLWGLWARIEIDWQLFKEKFTKKTDTFYLWWPVSGGINTDHDWRYVKITDLIPGHANLLGQFYLDKSETLEELRRTFYETGNESRFITKPLIERALFEEQETMDATAVVGVIEVASCKFRDNMGNLAHFTGGAISYTHNGVYNPDSTSDEDNYIGESLPPYYPHTMVPTNANSLPEDGGFSLRLLVLVKSKTSGAWRLDIIRGWELKNEHIPLYAILFGNKTNEVFKKQYHAIEIQVLPDKYDTRVPLKIESVYRMAESANNSFTWAEHLQRIQDRNRPNYSEKTEPYNRWICQNLRAAFPTANLGEGYFEIDSSSWEVITVYTDDDPIDGRVVISDGSEVYFDRVINKVYESGMYKIQLSGKYSTNEFRTQDYPMISTAFPIDWDWSNADDFAYPGESKSYINRFDFLDRIVSFSGAWSYNTGDYLSAFTNDIGFTVDTIGVTNDVASNSIEPIKPVSLPPLFCWGTGSTQWGAKGDMGLPIPHQFHYCINSVRYSVVASHGQAYMGFPYPPNDESDSCPNLLGLSTGIFHVHHSLLLLPGRVATRYTLDVLPENKKPMAVIMFVNQEDGGLWCSFINGPETTTENQLNPTWVTVQGLLSASPPWGWYIDAAQALEIF